MKKRRHVRIKYMPEKTFLCKPSGHATQITWVALALLSKAKGQCTGQRDTCIGFLTTYTLLVHFALIFVWMCAWGEGGGMCICVGIRRCVGLCVDACVYVCMCVFMHMCECVYVCVCMYACISSNLPMSLLPVHVSVCTANPKTIFSAPKPR